MKYRNKFPAEITAYEVIEAELEALALWCKGEIMEDASGSQYIALGKQAIYPESIIMESDGVFTVVEDEEFDAVYERVS